MIVETPVKIFSCTQSMSLSKQIAKEFGQDLGIVSFQRYSDGEFQPSFEESVRGSRVFIIGSTNPSTDNLMEMLLMLDAAKRASARHITSVIPYFGWARQDRKDKPRVPIGAKLVAKLLESAGATRIITMDLHADQIQGFFDVAVDNIYATPVMLDDIQRNQPKNAVVVSPDIGGVVRARAVAKQLDTDLAIIDKRRPEPNQAEIMNIIGEVNGRTCLIVDDIIDTAGTLCNAAKALKEEGANTVVAYCTHPVLSGRALENLKDSALDELVVTDSIPVPISIMETGRVRVITIAELLGEAVRRVSNEESISAMFR